jgi:ribosomal protein S19E (S16A)
LKAVDSVAPDPLVVASSLRRLRGSGLVEDDGDQLALTDEGRRMLDAAAGGNFWDEWERLRAALERLPLPETG